MQSELFDEEVVAVIEVVPFVVEEALKFVAEFEPVAAQATCMASCQHLQSSGKHTNTVRHQKSYITAKKLCSVIFRPRHPGIL